MGRILYMDAFSGISGDMTLGALLSLGFDINVLREEIKALGLDAEIEAIKVFRNGIGAMDFSVSEENTDRVKRDYAEIKGLLEEKMTNGQGKDIALEIFRHIAEAEAKIHGKEIEDVHFHEVGAIDSIVDIVGVGLGFSYLSPSRIVSGPVPLGRGFVSSMHGRLPVPAPATVQLLRGIPVYDSGIEGELVTPTGAAILKTLVDDFSGIPPMQILDSGYGAGKRSLSKKPNLLRLILGEEHAVSQTPGFDTDEVDVLTTNIDDMNPQIYDFVLEKLFSAGALDVTLNPIMMKKGRPGTVLTIISNPEKSGELMEIVLSNTTATGIRQRTERRLKKKRWTGKVDTTFGTIRVKYIATSNGGMARTYPEFDDVRRAAEKSGLPIIEVYQKIAIELDGAKVAEE